MTTHEELVEAVAQSIPGAPVRLQLSRAKGFDLQALSLATNGLPALNVSRPSKLGNPFMCTPDGCLRRMTEAQGGYRCCVDVYREYLLSGIEGRPSYTGAFRAMLDGMAGYPERARMIAALPRARGKNLACWCNLDDPCHADVLLELANRPLCEEIAY